MFPNTQETAKNTSARKRNQSYLNKQGVVTTNTPLEPFATGIKVFDQRKYTLIA